MTDEAYRDDELFPIPKAQLSLIVILPVRKPIPSQVELVRSPPHVPVNLHKNGSAEFNRHVRRVVIRVYRRTPYTPRPQTLNSADRQEKYPRPPM